MLKKVKGQSALEISQSVLLVFIICHTVGQINQDCKETSETNVCAMYVKKLVLRFLQNKNILAFSQTFDCEVYYSTK